jgi:hypothetical protein
MKKLSISLSAFALLLVILIPFSTFGKGKKATPPEHHETVIASVTANSITITEDKATKTFTVTQFTEVTVNGQRATLADLKPGMVVSVTLMDASRLSRITATSKP